MIQPIKLLLREHGKCMKILELWRVHESVSILCIKRQLLDYLFPLLWKKIKSKKESKTNRVLPGGPKTTLVGLALNFLGKK
jgi:hypothetical protein